MACPCHTLRCVIPKTNSLTIHLWCCLNIYHLFLWVSGPICRIPGDSGKEAAFPVDPGVRHVTAREPVNTSILLSGVGRRECRDRAVLSLWASRSGRPANAPALYLPPGE